MTNHKPRPRLTWDGRLPLTLKEGWCGWAEAAPPARPDQLSRGQLGALTAKAKTAYDAQRLRYHAALGPYPTPAVRLAHDAMWDTVLSNAHPAGRARPTVAIDGLAGLGKSTILQSFGRLLHNERRSQLGDRTPAGHEHLPVCHISLSGAATPRTLNASICDYYGLPTRGNSYELGARARNAILNCHTELILVDEIHFVNPRTQRGSELSNHLKAWSNEWPVTVVVAGIDLTRAGLLAEAKTDHNLAKAQTGRRMTPIRIRPFSIATPTDRREWRNLLRTIERDLVLADKQQGLLAEQLDLYLYDRTQGVILSLTSLLLRACTKAIRSGEELITRELLDSTRVDHTAESTRRSTKAGESPIADAA